MSRRVVRGRLCLGNTLESLEPRRLLAAAIAGVRTALPGELNPQIHALQLGAALVDQPSQSIYGALFAKPAAPEATSQNFIHPVSYSPFTLNESALRSELLQGGSFVMSIPNPDGTLQRFDVSESSIMEPGLAAQFPEIKTFAGQGVDDPTATIRLDVTDLGFHAQVLSPKGDYYIDPYWHTEKSAYISYFGRDLYPTSIVSHEEPLGGDPNEANIVGGADPPSATAYAGTLRTFRAAVAADGEYTAFWGGTVAAGQSAVVTAINRVTGIYETELDIRLTLVANNSSLIYTNASTDPYANTSDDVDTNTGVINGVIGSANYDIGHVFTTGSGGVAYLGCVGKTNKGGGTTGLPAPSGDAFYVDYVAHEMGHQFGANHTFNTAFEAGAGQRNSSTAYEVGSGSTIMAYAGIEDTDDLQPHSDPYFHFISIDEIRTFITVTIPSVGTSSSTGNSAPVVAPVSNYVIPTGTPFALTGSATDPNTDPLTYYWEERDLGAARNLNQADNGTSPLFRDYVPTTSPTRVFPRLSSILAGSPTTAAPAGGSYVMERLPTLARTAMKFRVVVRDNKPGGGGVASTDMQVQVVSSTAFLISNFNSSGTVTGGSNQTITWNVGSTTASPISTANVKITMSTDGGLTFPITLAASTENDGSATVQIPYNTGSTQTRFKVEAVANIFFDINNANLTLTNVVLPTIAPTGVTLDAAYDTGPSNSDRVTRLNNSTPKKLSFTVAGTTAGATVNVLADGNIIGTTTATGSSTSVLTNGTTVLSDGVHSITANQQAASAGISSATDPITVKIDTVAPTIGPLVYNPNLQVMVIKAPFSKDVSASLSPAALSVTGVSATSQASTFENTSNTASFVFTPGYDHGILPDGNYTATLLASAVTDLAGNHPDSDRTADFTVFTGDANFDRVINALDFNALAVNFGLPSRTYAQGNFNYDGDVNTLDFATLATKFNTRLAPAGAAITNAIRVNGPITASFAHDSLFNDGASIESNFDDVLT